MTFIRNNQINVLLFADVRSCQVEFDKPRCFDILKVLSLWIFRALSACNKLIETWFSMYQPKGILIYVQRLFFIAPLVSGTPSARSAAWSAWKRASLIEFYYIWKIHTSHKEQTWITNKLDSESTKTPMLNRCYRCVPTFKVPDGNIYVEHKTKLRKLCPLYTKCKRKS